MSLATYVTLSGEAKEEPPNFITIRLISSAGEMAISAPIEAKSMGAEEKETVVITPMLQRAYSNTYIAII